MTHAASAAIASNPWLAQPVTISHVIEEIPGVSTYYLQFADAARSATYQYQPGQFNMLYLPGAGEMPISISGGSAQAGAWAHTVRVVGNVTRALERLRPGGGLGLRGPYGSSWPLADAEGQDFVLVAGGIGLAPLRPVIHFLLAHQRHYGRIRLLYGSRSPDLLLYQPQFSMWEASGLDIHITVDRAAPGWMGDVGVVPLLLDRLWPLEADKTRVLVCGPEVMMRYCVRSALQRGVPKSSVWLSLERNMQCAVGLCGHCQLGPQFVCKDGPVFCYRDIEWLMRVEQF